MSLHDTPNATSIRILSLNCWGLKYISRHRQARLSEIGVRIASQHPPPDVVGLQECWTQEDYQSIRQQTSRILPHGKFYHGGIFGAGLVILSRWPIEESSMHAYPLNGRPTAFFRGDWYVGKGVACAKLRYGSRAKDVAEVFCTHLHAPYEREPNDTYLCHRTAQAWEITKLMRAAAERDHLVIGLGDFNMIPDSLAHRLVVTHAPVQDVWRVLHPDSSLGAAADAAEKATAWPVPSVTYNLTENGTTCDSAFNTWRWDKKRQALLEEQGQDVVIDGDTPDPNAKRLDYIFVGNGVSTGLSESGEAWRVEEARVGMLERHPVLRCSLSDHFSVEAVLTREHGVLQSSQSMQAGRNAPNEPRSNDDAYKRPHYLPHATYNEILAMISSYNTRQRRQRRLRLGHFIAQCPITIGCLVAIWWSPRNYVSFLLMLLGIVGFAAGVIDGLIGGLFISSELRALKEFEWEIQNLKNMAFKY